MILTSKYADMKPSILIFIILLIATISKSQPKPPHSSIFEELVMINMWKGHENHDRTWEIWMNDKVRLGSKGELERVFINEKFFKDCEELLHLVDLRFIVTNDHGTKYVFSESDVLRLATPDKIELYQLMGYLKNIADYAEPAGYNPNSLDTMYKDISKESRSSWQPDFSGMKSSVTREPAGLINFLVNRARSKILKTASGPDEIGVDRAIEDPTSIEYAERTLLRDMGEIKAYDRDSGKTKEMDWGRNEIEKH